MTKAKVPEKSAIGQEKEAKELRKGAETDTRRSKCSKKEVKSTENNLDGLSEGQDMKKYEETNKNSKKGGVVHS